MEAPTSVNSALRQPFRLLHLMVIAASVSITLILVLTGSGIYQVFERQLVEIAEKDAVQAGADLIQRETDLLLRTGPQGQVDLAINLENLADIDHRLQHVLEPFNIVKVNLFSPEWLILYSSDRSLIGRNEFGNARLDRALKGRPDSHLATQEEIVRLGEKQATAVDVVESYIPIRDPSGRVVGCLEVYRDVTTYRHELLTGVVASVLLLLMVLLGVFGISYLFLRKAAKRLQSAQEELRSRTTRDELTGLANRREILQRAQVEMSRMQRHDEQKLENCLALLVVDFDHLGLINQEYGRGAGDLVLQELSKRLSRDLRGYDAIGRYEGEEFLIILPANTRSGAQAAAERLRSKISNTPFLVGNLEIDVSVTIGLAIAQSRDATFEPTLQRAQRAMLEAKQRGGNCVVCEELIDIPPHPARVGIV